MNSLINIKAWKRDDRTQKEVVHEGIEIPSLNYKISPRLQKISEEIMRTKITEVRLGGEDER